MHRRHRAAQSEGKQYDPHAVRRLRCRALPALTAKQCSRCKTRYCGPECQVQHWEEGGHDKLCKKIKKAAARNSTTPIRNTRRP